MKKNRITLYCFLLILFSIVFTSFFIIPTFFDWLIDKDTRDLTFEEDVKVSKVIEDFYSDCFKLDYAKIKKFFFKGKVNINIIDGHNLLTDYEDDRFGTIETESDLNRIGIAGNVYYISIDVQYENAKTHQYFFIINGHKQFEIYEYKIEIL